MPRDLLRILPLLILIDGNAVVWAYFVWQAERLAVRIRRVPTCLLLPDNIKVSYSKLLFDRKVFGLCDKGNVIELVNAVEESSIVK